ncbi:MAG: hypothetical protein ACI9U2_002743 [Bradymonadia bacterium]|jgi:hypothetical protein
MSGSANTALMADSATKTDRAPATAGASDFTPGMSPSALGQSAELSGAAVQMRGAGGDDAAVHAAASHGTQGSGSTLPHFESVQTAFGRHDISNVQAYSGGAAAEASSAMGASAFATGNKVAFSDASPDLHTTAHEAAHVVQQRSGVSLYGGVGKAGDQYEQHADRVADAVVAGQGAEGILDEMAGGGSTTQAVQRDAVHRDAVQRDAVQRDEETTPDTEVEAAPDLTADKARVVNKVTGSDGWYDKTDDFAKNLARWNSRNWTAFIGACGGNYFVSWTAGQFLNAIGAIVSTVAGTLAGGVALGAVIGGTTFSVPGAVVGAVVGFLVSLIWGAIATMLSNDAAMATVDVELRRAAAQINEKNDEFDGQYDTTVGETRRKRDSVVAEVQGATTKAEIDRIETAVDGDIQAVNTPVSTADRGLYTALMQDWVLQHAGHEEGGNKETNAASYGANREEMTGVEPGDNLARRDLFLHQCKYEWARMGLDADWAVAELERRLPSGDGENVDEEMSNTPVVFTSVEHPEAMITKVAADFGRGPLAAKAEDQIRNNDFYLKCSLDLTHDWHNNTCYVDEYDYYIDLKAEMPSGYSQTANWSVSPD